MGEIVNLKLQEEVDLSSKSRESEKSEIRSLGLVRSKGMRFSRTGAGTRPATRAEKAMTSLIH